MRKLFLAAVLILLTFNAGSALALNLVTNGGFESGDFTGWNTSGSYVNVMNNYPASGSWYASLGTEGSYGTLAQLGIPTTPGLLYELSFDLGLVNSGANFNDFVAVVDGVTVGEQFWSGSQPYTPYSFLFTADESTDIAFFARNDGGLFALDDVNVDLAPVPEPCTLLLLGGGLMGVGLLRRKPRTS